MKIVERILRAGEGRTVKRLEGIAAQVNAIEEDFEKLTDAEADFLKVRRQQRMSGLARKMRGDEGRVLALDERTAGVAPGRGVG